MKNWYKILALCLIIGCGKAEKPPGRAFYYWKSVFSFSPGDSARYDSLGLGRLYIRFFDVDRRDGVVGPLSTLHWKNTPPVSAEVVPCVYIVNRTWENVNEKEASDLALKVADKIDRLRKGLPNRIPEIQVDCDWTVSTRKIYFYFLSSLRLHYKKLNIPLSATIRLHQVKYSDQTGIPPVDRGMLMYYNMGKIMDISTANSILDLETAASYLDNMDDYPLPLDLALPVYSWARWFRNGKPHELLESARLDELKACPLLAEEQPGRFICKENGIFMGKYLLKNDIFCWEEVKPSLCRDAAKQVSSRLEKVPSCITLYHWDPFILNQYGNQNLQMVYDAVR